MANSADPDQLASEEYIIQVYPGSAGQGLSLPRKSVVRLTDWLDMTQIVLTGLFNSNPTHPTQANKFPWKPMLWVHIWQVLYSHFFFGVCVCV